MDREQLEFQISQYADGTLPAAEIAALEAVLTTDAEARALLEQYRKLDAMLKRELPVPEVRWDRLAEHLSRAVEDEEGATYTLTWPGWWLRVGSAVAAMLVIAIGAAAIMRYRPVSTVKINSETPLAVVEVAGPSAEAATQPAFIEIAIKPESAATESNYRLADGIIYRPAKVSIATGGQPAQDNSRLPE